MISRIQTKKDLERSKRRKQLAIGGVMVFLLLLSTAGYALITNSHDEQGYLGSVTEGGFEFFQTHGAWLVTVGSQQFSFVHLPSQVGDVEVQGEFSISDLSANEPLYFTSPNDAIPQVIGNLGRFALRYQEVCLSNATCSSDLPVKSCSDRIVTWEASNITSVVRDGNCVHLTGDPMKAADAYVYKVLNII